MSHDFLYSFRTLRRSPAFAAVAILSMALGIGANTAIFSLLDQVLFRSLPVRAPERLVRFQTEYRAPGWSSSDAKGAATFSYPMYRDLRDRTTVFDGLIARSSAPVNLGMGGGAERARAEVVSGNYFQVLGVSAALGRLLSPDDDRTPGAHPVAVLSYGAWQRWFGGRADAVGQKVTANANPMTVIGVASPGFRGVLAGQTPDVFVPAMMTRAVLPAVDPLQQRSFHWLTIIGRVKEGVSPQRASAGAIAVYRGILQQELAGMAPLRNERSRQEFLTHPIELAPAAQGINELRRSFEKPLLAVMAMAGLVLLIACANVASLMLARAAGRSREIAVRLAIGAGRLRIMRQLLVEGLTIAAAGGVLGIVLAWWTASALVGMLPDDGGGGWLAGQLDWRMLGFALALSLLTGVLFAAAPALQSGASDLARALKERAGAATAGPARLRKLLVAAQIALSVLLLVGAGLFTRSLLNRMRLDLGFRPESLIMFSVDARLDGYDPPRTYAFYRNLQDRISRMPGVRAVGAAEPGPFSSSGRGGNITVQGYQLKGDDDGGSSMNAVSPGFFGALQIPMLAGREINGRDLDASQKVVVVNQAFARHYCAGRNPLGLRLAFGAGNMLQPDREIVGVAGDSRTGREEPRPAIYFPYAQETRPDRLNFYVRTSAEPAAVTGSIRSIVRSLDPNIPVSNLDTVKVKLHNSLFTDRMIAILAGSFGALATLLAVVGLYGVIAYAVARRTAEIGVRMALGATAAQVMGLVVREGAVLVGAGLVVGLPSAWALGRLVESQLFGLTAADPLVFAGATAALSTAALAAGLIPGWRAAHIDPIRALRDE